MGKESKWAKGQHGFPLFTSWKSQNGTKVIMSCCCLPPDRVKLIVNSKVKMGCCCLPPDWVKLTVNSKKETNSRVKMGEESKWAKGHNGLLLFTPPPLKESKWGTDHYGLLLFTLWESETNSEQQERNKEQGQNRQRVKMGFCYLPPERVKMGLLLFTPWQSQTNSEQQERNKQQGQNGQRVKMGQVSRWASVIYPLEESKWDKGHYELLLFTPDRVKLTVNSKKETNSRFKMGKESKWAKGQDGLLLCTSRKSQNGPLLFTPWQSQTNIEQQEKKQTAWSNWAKSQNGPRVKMGFCSLPPDRVKQAVNSKKESNSRVKMFQGSRWASVIYPLKESKWGKYHYGPLLFTPWQCQTSSEHQERNKEQGQNGPRVKMGFCYLPLDRVKLAVNSRKKQTAGSKWAKGHNGLLLFTPLKESKWGKDHYGLLLFTPWQSETSSEQQERNKKQGQNGQRVKMGFCYLPPE